MSPPSIPTTRLRIPDFEQLTEFTGNPKRQGYRLPAEFEPHAAVILARPHNRETWPGQTLEAAAEQHAVFASELAKPHPATKQQTPVIILDDLGIETEDAWVRDFGPLSVTCSPFAPWTPDNLLPARDTCDQKTNKPTHIIHDFHFNAWGNKYGPRPLDNLATQHLAKRLNLPIILHDFVFEGGAIDVNGKGLGLTTSQCLLHQNRNANLSQTDIQNILCDAFGLEELIFLPSGITGDDTDGHIDDIARFVREDVVVIATAPPDHPDFAVLDQNRQVLERRGLSTIPVPMPAPLFYDFPADRFDPAERLMLPASYANFLISNGRLFLPVFNQPSDDQAIRILEQNLPEYHVVPTPSNQLIVGMGALHCLSMQFPA